MDYYLSPPLISCVSTHNYPSLPFPETHTHRHSLAGSKIQVPSTQLILKIDSNAYVDSSVCS